MNDERPNPLSERVLVLAPTTRDTVTSGDLLNTAGIHYTLCKTIQDVCREVADGAGAAIITAEALLGDSESRLAAWLENQPAWSELPLIVLTPTAASPTLLRALDVIGHMTLMSRPVQVSTLISTVKSALRDRRRQYAVREMLEERRRTAEAFREERERYRVTLTSIGDAVIATDTEHRVTFLNEVAEQLTGWSKGAAIGHPLEEVFCIVNEVTRQPVPNPTLRALREGVVVGLANHTILISKGGREHPLDDSAAPIRNAEGIVVGAVLVFRDISERKRAEVALLESESRYRTLFESMDEGFCVVEMLFDAAGRPIDFRVLEVNPAFEKQSGIREATGRTMRELALDHEDHWFEIYGKVALTGEPIRFMNEAKALGGRWFNVYAFRVGGPLSRKVAILFSDITSWKRAEEVRDRDSLLLANVHDAVVVTDLDGIVTYWNEGATRLFGWTAAEMLGRSYADRFPDSVRTWVVEEIRLRATGSEWNGEYQDYRKDGSRVWIDARMTRVNDAAGRMVGILGLSHDIAERKQAEEALKDADRRKDDFIALLAHELRNPLAPIRNGLQVMRLADGDPNVVAKARAIMDRQLCHMVRLIDDLLDISRISRNKMELRRTRVLLSDVVSNAVEIVRPVIDAARHVLSVSLPPQPIFLDADLTRLAQVFGNLLTNSAKYTENGGQIWLNATCGDDTVTLSVRDTGIGIPVESLSSIFDMFSQVDRSIERATGGLGIGLALVKSLVEMHGGKVKATSAGRGKGSEFSVMLPIFKSQTQPQELVIADTGHASAGTKRRMLVVDDNVDSATSMGLMLTLLGDEVRTANDGVKAVEAAEQFRPDVILMDVGMPRLNGLDATRQIRSNSWGTSTIIIALTGWGQVGDRVQSKEAGCDGHLVKPVSLSDLEKVLADLCENRTSTDTRTIN